VPPLPFAQYTQFCALDDPSGCVKPNCNHFKCPLPTGSEQCKGNGHGPVLVHCK
jgi:hypothetical protein